MAAGMIWHMIRAMVVLTIIICIAATGGCMSNAFSIASKKRLPLSPSRFHIMVDSTRQDDNISHVRLEQEPQPDASLPILLDGQWYRPVSERQQYMPTKSNNEKVMLWQVSLNLEYDNAASSNNLRMSSQQQAQQQTSQPQEEIFVLCGDEAFVVQAMNHHEQGLPSSAAAGAQCLWYPTSDATRRDLLHATNNPLSIWKLRSNPGILGLVVEWQDLLVVVENDNNNNSGADSSSVLLMDLGQLSARLQKIRQPCSAMDYPPTIFMIGEDEIS